MKFLFPMILGALVLAAMPANAGVDAQVKAGMRLSEFNAAPDTRDMWLQEFDGVLTSTLDVRWPVSVGLLFGYQEMRGSLGTGLESFSGMRAGPEVTTWWPMTAQWAPFASLGYTWGSYHGKGSTTWGESDNTTIMLYGPETAESSKKTYSSAGAEIALGLRFAATAQLSALAEFDAGIGTLTADQDVLLYGQKLTGAGSSSFDSRAFLFGGQMSF